jgi:hypothetical protein
MLDAYRPRVRFFKWTHGLRVLPVDELRDVRDSALNGKAEEKMKQHIRKLAILCGLALALVATSVAQDLGSLGKQAQNLGGMNSLMGLAQKLHLSPEQLQQVMPILQGEVPKLQAISGKTGLNNTQKLEQTKAVQKQSDSKLKNMLSPEQFTSLQSFRSLQRKDVLQGLIPQ